MRSPKEKPPTHLPKRSPKGYDIRWVRTSVLMRRANPFKGCWPEMDKPLTVADVLREVEAGTAQLHDEFAPWWGAPRSSDSAADQARFRVLHAQKIAWFALNGFQEPLEVDVGVPSLGYHIGYPVLDGNHRLAAAIVRRVVLKEDPWLPLSVGGEVNYAKRLGLW